MPSRRSFLVDSLLTVTSAAAASAHRPFIRSQEIPAGDSSNRSVTAEDFIDFLGGFPSKPPLKIRVLEQHNEGGYIRKCIDYLSAEGVRVPAFLLIPQNEQTHHGPRLFPGIVAIHQDGNRDSRDIGKSEPAGLVGDADQHYGKELCLRGYIVLCPDRRGFENRKDKSPASLQGDLFDLHRAVDFLLAQPETDSWKGIGAIGHSAGGWMAAMLSFLDSRVRACAVSCGTWLYRWRELPQGRLPSGYHVPRPPIPFLDRDMDQDDFLAGIAPRPYIEFRESWTPILDNELQQKARVRYTDLGVQERFQWIVHDFGHTFPENLRRRSYAWLDSWLQVPGSPR
jgi:dienelactone hydrolase